MSRCSVAILRRPRLRYWYAPDTARVRTMRRLPSSNANVKRGIRASFVSGRYVPRTRASLAIASLQAPVDSSRRVNAGTSMYTRKARPLQRVTFPTVAWRFLTRPGISVCVPTPRFHHPIVPRTCVLESRPAISCVESLHPVTRLTSIHGPYTTERVRPWANSVVPKASVSVTGGIRTTMRPIRVFRDAMPPMHSMRISRPMRLEACPVKTEFLFCDLVDVFAKTPIRLLPIVRRSCANTARLRSMMTARVSVYPHGKAGTVKYQNVRDEARCAIRPMPCAIVTRLLTAPFAKTKIPITSNARITARS